MPRGGVDCWKPWPGARQGGAATFPVSRAISRPVSRAVSRAVMLLAALTLLAPAAAAAKPRRAAQVTLEAALRRHVETLASDDFAGREPGTPGETRALRYLARVWFDIGLESGTNRPGHNWFAPVDLIERRPAQWRASFVRGARRTVAGREAAFVVTSGLRSLAVNAPVLFVGDGTRAVPGRAELAGRIALMLDAAPPGTDRVTLQERESRLLDGGAAGVITVLDGDRTLGDLRAQRGRAGYALAGERLGGDIVAYLAPDLANRVLAGGAEGDIAALRRAARSATFAPRLLGFAATLEATSRDTRIHTNNLIGRIPGRNPAAGAVLLVAHWDHFGTCAEPPAKDLLCRGAVDNASGVAVITEAARLLAADKPADRDIYVLATTGEELGLLGARAFAEDPPLPLRKIVAAFNVDTDAIAPAGQPFVILGKGKTGLDAEIERVVKKAGGRLIVSDAAQAYLKRQDGWMLLQHDVPAVMVSTAFADMPRLERFMETRYHRPADKADPGLELGGAADDARMLAQLARDFADVKAWPGAKTP